VIPTIVEAVSVKTGERLAEQPTIATVRTTLDELAHMVSEVRGAWKAGSELARQGGPSCRFCPLLDSCDEGRVAAEVLTIPKA